MISSSKKIGVDIGSTSVKMIEIAKVGKDITLANWSFMPYRIPENADTEAVRKTQAAAVDAALKKSDCKCRDVVLGIPGSSAFIRNIKLPPVPTSKIDQIIRYEVQQTIPFPIEDIALDYQVLEPDESSEVEVIMVAMKGTMAETLIKDAEQAKIKVGIMDSVPLAVYNCYRYNGYSSKEECTAIIEMGASASNILIELAGELRYCRNVGIGGNAITEAIAKEFNIPFAQAERIKIQQGLIFPETEEANFNEDQVRVSKAIAAVLDRLRGEIKLTIGYFRSLTGATAITRAVLAGGSAMLKNISPFLADRLGVPVGILNPFRNLKVPKNHINVRKVAPIFAASVGLALRSSQGCCQLKVSLIPPQVVEAQSRRGKIICNAISFILLVSIMGLYMWRMMPEPAQDAEKIAELDREIAKYKKVEGKLDKLESEKKLLRSEYNLYAPYPQKTLDVVTPVAALTGSVGETAWIESINIKKGEILVSGVVQSAGEKGKVEALRNLSALRSDLEKFCKKVDVKNQRETKEGIAFILRLQDMVGLSNFMKMQENAKKNAKKKDEAKAKGA